MMIRDRAALRAALEVDDDAALEERLDANSDLDVLLDWSEDPDGIVVVIHGRGTILEFPFELADLWAALDELEDEMTAELEEDETAGERERLVGGNRTPLATSCEVSQRER